MGRLKAVKQQVEQCLIKEPETRNSDMLLWLTVCKMFHNENLSAYSRVVGDLLGDHLMTHYGDISKMKSLPSTESVRRNRQWFNEHGHYFPTDPEVLKQRKLSVARYKKDLGY